MAINSTFYDTLPGQGVTELPWARSAVSRGPDYGVVGPDDLKLTAHPTTPFAVVLSAGKFWGHGVWDESDASVTVQCDTVAGGATRWDLIVGHRDWTPTGGGPTALSKVNGTSSKAIPVSRANTPGEIDDQPLWLVQWTGGQTWPTAIIDLRCWAGNGGVVIADILARDYLARPGADVLLGSTTWRYTIGTNGAWGWIDQSPLIVPAAPVAGAVKPDWAPLRAWSGFVSVSKGAGGENRDATPATNAVGEGGLWFGYNGMPSFSGIYSVQLTGEHGLSQFTHVPTVLNISTARIKFKSRRLDGSGWANGYGGIAMHVTVIGW